SSSPRHWQAKTLGCRLQCGMRWDVARHGSRLPPAQCWNSCQSFRQKLKCGCSMTQSARIRPCSTNASAGEYCDTKAKRLLFDTSLRGELYELPLPCSVAKADPL